MVIDWTRRNGWPALFAPRVRDISRVSVKERLVVMKAEAVHCNNGWHGEQCLHL